MGGDDDVFYADSGFAGYDVFDLGTLFLGYFFHRNDDVGGFAGQVYDDIVEAFGFEEEFGCRLFFLRVPSFPPCSGRRSGARFRRGWCC